MNTQPSTTPPQPGTASPDPAGLPLFTAPGFTGRPSARNLGGAKRPETAVDDAVATGAVSSHVTALRPARSTTLDELGENHHTDHQDWTLVRTLRTQVAEQVRDVLTPEQLAGGLNRTVHEPLALDLVNGEIANYNSRQVAGGGQPLSTGAVARLRTAVLDAIFGLGRLERLLHLEGLEDIYIRGADNVILSFADGRKVAGPPVADSDAELIADLQHLAAVNPHGERAFSTADKMLDLTLPNGDRLSASAWFTPRPMVTIRRHGYVDIALDTLVELGALDEAMQQFLVAAVQAGINVVVSGLPASGKTTMIRALLNELPPSVALGTIESEFELGLHNLRHRHPNVWAAQTMAGGEDGAGAITLSDLVVHSLRQSIDRIIVGEVRGQEILPMLDAMQAGKGSVSTVHATSTRHTVDRLVNLAMKAGPHITAAYAYRMIADNVDLVVSIQVIDETPIGGRKHRFIQQIDALQLSDDAANGVAFTPIFAPGPDGRGVPTGNRPAWIDQLEMHGFDPAWLVKGASTWSRPLELLRGRRSA